MRFKTGGTRMLGLVGQLPWMERVAVVRAASGIGRRCVRGGGCTGRLGVLVWRTISKSGRGRWRSRRWMGWLNSVHGLDRFLWG